MKSLFLRYLVHQQNQQNHLHLQLSAGKTKDLVVDFRRHKQPCTQVPGCSPEQ